MVYVMLWVILVVFWQVVMVSEVEIIYVGYFIYFIDIFGGLCIVMDYSGVYQVGWLLDVVIMNWVYSMYYLLFLDKCIFYVLYGWSEDGKLVIVL